MWLQGSRGWAQTLLGNEGVMKGSQDRVPTPPLSQTEMPPHLASGIQGMVTQVSGGGGGVEESNPAKSQGEEEERGLKGPWSPDQWGPQPWAVSSTVAHVMCLCCAFGVSMRRGLQSEE